MKNVERAAADFGGVPGGELRGAVVNLGQHIVRALPATGGDVLIKRGERGVKFVRRDFAAKKFQAQRGADFNFLPVGQCVRRGVGRNEPKGVRAVRLLNVEFGDDAESK